MAKVILDGKKAKCPVQLECNQNGVPYRSADNVMEILRNDPALAGKISRNKLSKELMVTGELPWARDDDSSDWEDEDLDALCIYINKYIQVPKSTVLMALNAYSRECDVHPIRDFLFSLHEEKVWDGVHRIDTFLHDYAGVDVREDTHYDSWIMRHWLLSAIHRVIVPGCKIDHTLVLHGIQGGGKSHMIMALAMRPEWYCEDMPALDHPDAPRVVNTAWIIGLEEMLSVKSAKSWPAVKKFLTCQRDTVRRLYSNTPKNQPRHCVFIGSTDSQYFLSDPTGSRRFLPIHVDFKKAKMNLYADEHFVIKQIWAEAMELYITGGYEQRGIFAIYLTEEQQAQAEAERQSFTEENYMDGVIQAWLDKLPADKNRVCAAMIWNCALKEPVSKLTRKISNDLHSIMQNKIDGWQLYSGSADHKAQCGNYGKQICYERVK